jgi:hypothetical protein
VTLCVVGCVVLDGLAALSKLTTKNVSTYSGLPFIIAATLLGFLYWKTASVYGQASRGVCILPCSAVESS